MDQFTVLATILGLLLTALGVLVTFFIARRQGVFRKDALLVTLAIPKLLPMSSTLPRFGRAFGPKGARRLGAVYPIMMKTPPCVAINLPRSPERVVFFLPIAVCNLGDSVSNNVELNIVTSNNLAAEKITELGDIRNITTERRELTAVGELQVSHSIGEIKKGNHEIIGEVFALDLGKHSVEDNVIRVALNIAAHSEDSYADAHIIIFLTNADSREDLMSKLAYQAKMEYKRCSNAFRRLLALGRPFNGRACMWIYPEYKTMEDGVILHQFERPGDSTDAGILLPIPFGQFSSP